MNAERKLLFCAVRGCGHHGFSSLGFYKVPRDICSVKVDAVKRKITFERRKQWLALLFPEHDSSYYGSRGNGYVCSRHFKSGKPSDWNDVDNEDWLPTQNLGYELIQLDVDGSQKYIIPESSALCDDEEFFQQAIEYDDGENGIENDMVTTIPELLIKCSFCFEQFQTLELAEEHTKVMHNLAPLPQNHRCGVCVLNFPTKDACMAHITQQHGTVHVMSNEAHKNLTELVELLVNFDWCQCMQCLMHCKTLLDHIFDTHPVKSATLERQKEEQQQAKQQMQLDHSYHDTTISLETVVDNNTDHLDSVQVSAPSHQLGRWPSSRTTIVNRKSVGDPRPEYQCYFCGDVSMIREDIAKCMNKHRKNNWQIGDNILLGDDADYGDGDRRAVDETTTNSDHIDEENLTQDADVASQTQKFSCDPCTLRFESAKDLRQHIRTHGRKFHNLAPDEARIQNINECKFCMDMNGEKIRFETRRESMQHRRDHHFYLPDANVLLDNFIRFVVSPDGSDILADGNFRYFLKTSYIERFECVCLQTYQSLTSAERCLARHIGVKPFKCNQADCHYDFYTISELRSHEKRIHFEPVPQEKVVCEMCGMSVVKSRQRMHWRKEHSAPVACDVCGNTYKNQIRLRIHKRTVHEKEKRFRCRICHKRFIHKSSANLCLAKHNNERRVACNFCNRKFHTSAQRNSHRLATHGKLEPNAVYNNVCNSCEFVGRTETILQKHQSLSH